VKLKAVSLVKDHVVKIIQGCFTLQRELMERVEAVEGERSHGSIKRSRKPAGAQNLSALMDDPVRPTVTEVDSDVMNSGCVENAEVSRTGGWKRTRSTAVPQLDTKTETLKGNRSEKKAIPNL